MFKRRPRWQGGLIQARATELTLSASEVLPGFRLSEEKDHGDRGCERVLVQGTFAGYSPAISLITMVAEDIATAQQAYAYLITTRHHVVGWTERRRVPLALGDESLIQDGDLQGRPASWFAVRIANVVEKLSTDNVDFENSFAMLRLQLEKVPKP